MTIPNRRTAHAIRAYTRRHAPNVIGGMLGNNAGTVDHPRGEGWVWVRLFGDPNRPVVASDEKNSVQHVNGLLVELEWSKDRRCYVLKGLMPGVYPDLTWALTVGAHASQHERRDFGEGGPDPLDVYTRMLTPLRARAQAVPDMTLYVEIGWYDNAGTRTKWSGGNSGAFTVPAGNPFAAARRCDLLYVKTDDTLAIAVGTDVTVDGSTPDYPATPADCCLPLAFVFLDSNLTAVTEEYIEDARALGGSSAGAVGLPDHHALHENGGSQEIDVTGLSGLLADPQTSLAHNHPAAGELLTVDPFAWPIAADALDTQTANANGWHNCPITSRELNGTIWQVYCFYNAAGQLGTAVRRLPGEWTVYTTAGITFPVGGDGHNHIGIGLDPDGYLHIVEGNHADALRYRRSTLPVSSFAGVYSAVLSMLGTNEAQATYPTFFNDPSGNLYFMFRDGVAANGDLYFYQYSHATATWAAAAGTGAAGKLIDGKSDVASPYWVRPVFDANFGSGGKLHLFWAWCDGPGNTYPCWSYCSWDGTDFHQSTGAAQTVPIRMANDEEVDNLGGVTTQPTVLHQGGYSDAGGHPHVVYGRDDGDGYVYLYHLWHDGTSWVKLKLSDAVRTTTAQRGIWPVLALDRDTNTCWVAYTDLAEANSYIYLLVSDPNDFTVWSKYTLWPEETDGTGDGVYQPKFDAEDWERSRRLSIPVEYWPTGAEAAPISLVTWIPGGGSLRNAIDYPDLHANDTDTASGIHHTIGTGAAQAAAGNHTHALDDLSDVVITAAQEGHVLTRAGGNWINQPPEGGAGGGHLHGLGRWLSDGGTVLDLVDVAEYLEAVFDDGSLLDPAVYSLSAAGVQVALDSAPAAGSILTAQYVIRSL